tara:strand:+ start:215 stop:511 length:297 start_codon:yes stop_codon:yes gene_type:complete
MPVQGFRKTIVAAGAAERIISTSVYVTSVTIKAKKANTGEIYIGQDDVGLSDPPLEAGDSLHLPVPSTSSGPVQIDLRDIWVNASVDGDGVDVWYSQL